MDRLLRLVEEHAKRIDNLNKRLVITLAACVCTGLIVIGILKLLDLSQAWLVEHSPGVNALAGYLDESFFKLLVHRG